MTSTFPPPGVQKIEQEAAVLELQAAGLCRAALFSIYFRKITQNPKLKKQGPGGQARTAMP